MMVDARGERGLLRLGAVLAFVLLATLLAAIGLQAVALWRLQPPRAGQGSRSGNRPPSRTGGR
jgi:hypothetical protein